MFITGELIVECPHCEIKRLIKLNNHEVQPYAFRKNIYCEATDELGPGCNKDFAVSIKIDCKATIRKTKIVYTEENITDIF